MFHSPPATDMHESLHDGHSEEKNPGVMVSRGRSVRSYNSPLSGPFFGSLQYQRKPRALSSIAHDQEDAEQREKENDEFFAFFRVPAWLINRAWELHINQTRSGWKFNPSTYNVIPNGSLIFRYAGKDIRSHNLYALRELFKNREASPFDRDEDGNTALHVHNHQTR
jgi:hypothetical protein